MEAATQPRPSLRPAYSTRWATSSANILSVLAGRRSCLLNPAYISYSLYDSLPCARLYGRLLAVLHVSAFRHLFRRCFGVFFCEIANKNAVCFGVSPLGVSLAEEVSG